MHMDIRHVLLLSSAAFQHVSSLGTVHVLSVLSIGTNVINERDVELTCMQQKIKLIIFRGHSFVTVTEACLPAICFHIRMFLFISHHVGPTS